MARILVIEDNEPNLELMTYLLGASGHDISSATDGAQGIEMALADFPDLVVLDIQLPDLNGYEVLDRMRRSPNLATVLGVSNRPLRTTLRTEPDVKSPLSCTSEIWLLKFCTAYTVRPSMRIPSTFGTLTP